MKLPLLSVKKIRNIQSNTGFLPSDFSGLKLWLDPTDIDTITFLEFEDVRFVTQQDDKSGNDNNAIRLATYSSPITNANTIGGRNVITYYSSRNMLAIPAHSSIDNLFSGGGSVFSVVNPLPIAKVNFSRIFDAGASASSYIRVNVGGKVQYAHISGFSSNNGSFNTVTSDIIMGEGNILGLLYDNSLVTNIPVFRINRSLIATEIRNTPVGTATLDVGGDLCIGNRFAADRAWIGYLGEILMYNRILNDGEIAVLEDYLSNKWGLTLIPT